MTIQLDHIDDKYFRSQGNAQLTLVRAGFETALGWKQSIGAFRMNGSLGPFAFRSPMGILSR